MLSIQKMFPEGVKKGLTFQQDQVDDNGIDAEGMCTHAHTRSKSGPGSGKRMNLNEQVGGTANGHGG